MAQYDTLFLTFRNPTSAQFFSVFFDEHEVIKKNISQKT